MVIRPLHPLDVTRCAILGGPGKSNRARTLDSLGKEKQPRLSIVEAAWLTLALQGRGVCSQTWTEEGRVAGIAAARQRSGPRSWEVFQLLLGSNDKPFRLDLIGMLCRAVAASGGERVFIRLRDDDPLVGPLTAYGMASCAHELLYRSVRLPTAGVRPAPMRKKTPVDEHDLFRLYNAATPSQSRLLTGMTFEQWRSSRERSRGREYVYHSGGQVKGWVKTSRRLGSSQVQVIVHPEAEKDVSHLLDFGLAALAGAKKVWCLAPAHNVILQRVLSQRSYECTGEYVTLVKTMALPARDKKARRAVTMTST